LLGDDGAWDTSNSRDDADIIDIRHWAGSDQIALSIAIAVAVVIDKKGSGISIAYISRQGVQTVTPSCLRELTHGCHRRMGLAQKPPMIQNWV
jgi:hypothetical protein